MMPVRITVPDGIGGMGTTVVSADESPIPGILQIAITIRPDKPVVAELTMRCSADIFAQAILSEASLISAAAYHGFELRKARR